MSIGPFKRIVILGDSNTEGHGIQPWQTYPTRLQKNLGDEVSVYNFGVSGACVTHVMVNNRPIGMPYILEENYKKALEAKGDLYIVNLGTNDAVDGLDDTLDQVDPFLNVMAHRDKFTQSYEDILEGIIASNPKAKMVLCIPIPVLKCVWRKHQQHYLDRVIPYIRTIALRKDYEVIDLMHSLGQHTAIETLYLEDGLHLNEKGAAFVADVLLEHLAQLKA
jgi:acyl-CoA thioesterase-1